MWVGVPLFFLGEGGYGLMSIKKELTHCISDVGYDKHRATPRRWIYILVLGIWEFGLNLCHYLFLRILSFY